LTDHLSATRFLATKHKENQQVAPKSSKTAAIYVRVSTGGQTIDNQLRELRAVARRSGWKVVEVYKDEGISGAKGRDQRPAFDQLCQDATRRKFDVVMAWSVDRLGRSLQHLVTFLDELQALKLDLYLQQQGIDTTTPSGRAMFQMCGVFAEFERSMIQERVKAGLARAKEQGTKSGKPIGRPEVYAQPAVQARVSALKEKGFGTRRIAEQLGVSRATVIKVLRAA
jgi:DNA invertase Pin-like site-specific DNA recombinase